MRRALLAAVLMSACGGVPAAASSHRFTDASVPPDTSNASQPAADLHLGAPNASPRDIRTTTTARASRGRVSVSEVSTSTTADTSPQIGTALQVARASWYGEGTRTASGARFDPSALTFASRTLPFGTVVRFTLGDRHVTATCNDRGPVASTGRLFDLSRASFAALAPLSVGVIVVSWEIV